MNNLRLEYAWMLKPISNRAKKIREQAKIKEAKRVGIKMKAILISMCILILTNCSLIPKAQPVKVLTVAEPVPMYHPPLPLEVQLVDIEWEILTPKLMNEYLSELESGSAPARAYYTLTSKDYENLSMNMAEIKRYLKDTLHVIEFYREYDKKVNDEEKVSDNK